MLVFTRRIDQAIVIGEGIEVKVLRVGRDGVWLGVSAAPHVSVHRAEVYEQIRRANASAASDVGALAALLAKLRRRPDQGA